MEWSRGKLGAEGTAKEGLSSLFRIDTKLVLQLPIVLHYQSVSPVPGRESVGKEKGLTE